MDGCVAPGKDSDHAPCDICRCVFQLLKFVLPVLQTSSKLYLVLDFINGGHLFFQLYRQGIFSEVRMLRNHPQRYTLYASLNATLPKRWHGIRGFRTVVWMRGFFGGITTEQQQGNLGELGFILFGDALAGMHVSGIWEANGPPSRHIMDCCLAWVALKGTSLPVGMGLFPSQRCLHCHD
jgi:hypothetical protein